MTERDPIETLARVSDAAENPNPDFAERLLDNLLSDLASTSSNEPTILSMFEREEGTVLPAIDLLAHTTEGTANMNRNRIIGGLLAAAAAVALVMGVVVSLDDDDEVVTVPADAGTETTTTVEAAGTTPAVVFGETQALAQVDDFFSAYGAFDWEAMQGLFTPGATFNGQFHIAQDEKLFVWNEAQATTVTPPDCSAGEQVDESVTVTCAFFNQDALVQAVDGPPVPIRMTFTVGLDGISGEFGAFFQPDFNTVGVPFEAWMTENHPEDVDKVEFGNWASIEEATQNGTMVAQYAAEWAAHLEANGCTYQDGAC